ncbi:MAG: hypothetical protein AAB467_03145 [Patescibacteria group bacterium]
MDLNKLIKSKFFIWTAVGLFEIAIILCAFRVGMVVGFSKANYSFRWGQNYHRLFGGPARGWFDGGRGMMGQFDKDDYISGHNVVGSIIKISSSTITVKATDNTEKSLLISAETVIRSGNANVQVGALKENDRIVALGTPSSTGQIEVKFMRIFHP